jgi:hypothetical protein
MKLALTIARILNGMSFLRNLTALVTLLVCSCVLAQNAQITKIDGSRYEGQRIPVTVEGKRFENLSFTASSYLGGKLSIKSSDRPNTTITYQKVFKADSKSEAESFDSFIDFTFEKLENELAISAETKSSPPWSGTDYSAGVNVQIEVPQNNNLKIDIRTSVFLIDIIGPFASVDITNTFGEISVARITNRIRVSSENGSVTIRDCTGPTTVTTAARPIELSNIDSKLGTIKLRNSAGRITLVSVKGEIDARTDAAPITGRDIRIESGNSTFSTENSNIKIDLVAVNGDLTVRSDNGRIDLSLPSATSAYYTLQVEDGGRIITKSLPMRVDTATRTLVRGSAGARQNKIEVDMGGVGAINLEGKLAGRVSIR